MPETYPIRLEGKVLEWTTSIKHVGNYTRNDLSESDEIRHKQGDLIGRINGLLARYHDVTPEVLMQLTSSYCTHLYGSQAWQLNDINVHRIFTTWNKAIGRMWNLPTLSYRVLLCGINEGNSVYDYVFKQFIKMYNSMKCKNTKMVYLTLLAKNDKRSIISKYFQFICETANTKEPEVINRYKSNVYKRGHFKA